MNDFNHYLQILGLSKGASLEDIKRAYRRLAKKYHPDLSKRKSGSSSEFLKIQEAYEYLIENIKKIPIQKRSTSFSFNKPNTYENDYRSFFQEFEKIIQTVRNDFVSVSSDYPETFVDLKRIIKEREKKYYF